MTTVKNEYHQQAEDFLARFGIGCRITLSDSKPARWSPAGHHYRVTLSKTYKTKGIYPARLVFDFWGSAADAKAGTQPHAYDVLACISGDTNCAETFEGFCSDFGYSTDSIDALQTFRRCSRFSERLREFLSAKEIEALSEIS